MCNIAKALNENADIYAEGGPVSRCIQISAIGAPPSAENALS
jgi:hypothetical protein